MFNFVRTIAAYVQESSDSTSKAFAGAADSVSKFAESVNKFTDNASNHLEDKLLNSIPPDFQSKLSGQISSVFDDVCNEKISKEHEEKLILSGRNGSKEIIASTAWKNASITAGCALVPGPYGLLTIIPELYLITQNQLQLVRDLAIAYGHKDKISKELLMLVYGTSIGTMGIGLATVHGSKLVLKRPALRVVQKIVTSFGGKITQKLARQTLGRFIPVLGAAAMGAWTKYSTEKIGEVCCEILEKDIVISDEILDDIEVSDLESHSNEVNIKQIELETLKLYINLAKVDGLNEDEIKYIESFINKIELPTREAAYMRSLMRTSEPLWIDYSVFTSRYDKELVRENLLFFAKVDDQFSEKELVFINNVISNLQIS